MRSWAARTRKHLPVVVAFALLFVAVFGISRARYDVEKKRVVRADASRAYSGDEPHYVGVMNSILFDHDLALAEDYRRARLGGRDFGALFVKGRLNHHTIIVDRTTAEQDLWMNVYDPEAHLSCDDCVGFVKLTDRFPMAHDLVEVPAHPIAFPAILAAAVAPFHPTLATSESYAGIVIVFLSWLTAVVTYALGVHTFRARLPALAAAVLLSFSPWLPYARSYFCEPMIGLMLVSASLAMAKRRTVLAGIALAVAIAIKAPFVLVAAAFAIDLALAREWRAALTLTAVVGALGLALAAFNFSIAGTPLIVGAGGTPPPGGLKVIFDTLLEEDHGIICFAPWAPFAFLGVAGSFRRESSVNRAAAIAILFYFSMLCVLGNGPGFCYGPRYWIPLLPWLSIEAVRFCLKAQVGYRIVAGAAMVLGAIIAVSGSLLYATSFSEAANRWW